MSNHIVLVHPAIPQNTGNIMRTCVATGTTLHLVRPLGFKLDDKSLKRAGMDYISALSWQVYESFDDFTEKNSGEYFFLTRYAKKVYSDMAVSDPEKDYYFFFGHEHDGIPRDILRAHLEACYRIPMVASARSLNLSNCAALVLYEALRQQGFPGLSAHEVIKGENFLYE